MSYKDKQKEKEYKKKWYIDNCKNNPEWKRAKSLYNKQYAKINRKRINILVNRWRIANPERQKSINRRRQIKRQANISYRIGQSVSVSMWKALKMKKAGYHWETLVGYTVEDLIKHLESKFEPWMSWDNYGEWEIDHIKPQSLFHYETAEDPEFKECWALVNLQPMEKIANIKKHNHYVSK